ncbi:hypothetical protein MRX96_026078 [Rhipicephalus microplus]
MSGSYELHQPPSHAMSPPLISEESLPFSRIMYTTMQGGSPTANGDGPALPSTATKTGWVRTSASMNPNLYATKKTLAQGMLRRGPALGQRHPAEKHHSARGDDHEFYTVLVVLISFSPSDCR